MIKNFVWKGKKPKLLRTTLKKKNEVGGLTLHDLKTQSKSKVIKSVVSA